MVQSIMLRLLGTIPAPLIFGAIFDASCILWQDTCGVGGSCFFYDKQNLAFYMFGVCIGYKCLALVFMVCAWKCYVPPKFDPDAIVKDVDADVTFTNTAADVIEMKTTQELNKEFDRQLSTASNNSYWTSRDALVTSQDDETSSEAVTNEETAKKQVALEKLEIDSFFDVLLVESKNSSAGKKSGQVESTSF